MLTKTIEKSFLIDLQTTNNARYRDPLTLKSDSKKKKKKSSICFNESPLKMVKNAFYFISKALFMFQFLSWLFGRIERMAWLKQVTATGFELTTT